MLGVINTGPKASPKVSRQCPAVLALRLAECVGRACCPHARTRLCHDECPRMYALAYHDQCHAHTLWPCTLCASDRAPATRSALECTHLRERHRHIYAYAYTYMHMYMDLYMYVYAMHVCIHMHMCWHSPAREAPPECSVLSCLLETSLPAETSESSSGLGPSVQAAGKVLACSNI